jgi:hypothetical protein
MRNCTDGYRGYGNLLRCISSAIIGLALCAGCADEGTSDTADAGTNTKELTVYVGPPTPFRAAISANAIEQFATVSGYHLEFIQLNSWFVRVQGDPPIDLLDNLDLFINDDQKFYDVNPIRRRNPPDLILTSAWDTHIRKKAEEGYFSPVSELFVYSPDFRKAHSSEFWKTNLRGPSEFGIPLYAFQQDDVPGYWLIDAQYRRTLVDRPISSFAEFLDFAELAVQSTVGTDPVLSTSAVPLGAMALTMEYGYVPLYPLADASSRAIGAFGTDVVIASPFRRSSRNRLAVPYRSHQLFSRLGNFPFVYDPVRKEITNVIAKPPDGYEAYVRQISRIVETGRVNTTRSQAQGFSAFLMGTCKAVFLPADFGLETLYSLVLQFPGDFNDRYEIVPVSKKAIASLEASFRAWIPETTDNLDKIAELFTLLSDSEIIELLRYGSTPEYWKASDPYGISPGEMDIATLFLPTGYYLELLTRTGIPERVPAVISPRNRPVFRLDDSAASSYIHFPTLESIFDPTPILGALATWDDISFRYTRMLEGTEDYVLSRTFLTTSGERAFEVIEAELKKQLAKTLNAK